MNLVDFGTTNPSLMRRVVDWNDDTAWGEIVERYRPLVQQSCRLMRLDEETADEVCQRVWIDLFRRMASFKYDPSKSFRSWLRRLCQWRSADALRSRRRDRAALVIDHSLVTWRLAFYALGEYVDDGTTARRPALLELGDEIQQFVRSQVEARTWQAFWSIGIDGLSVGETAEALNLSYAAAFAAHKRVAERLREAGRCALAQVRKETDLERKSEKLDDDD